MEGTVTRPNATQVGRRGFLEAAGGTAVGIGTLGATAGTAGAQEGSGDAGGWFDGVDNDESVVDETDQSKIEVSVGTKGNGGNFAFSPPAIHIDPGTTVVWRRVVDNTALLAVAEDESFWTDFGDGETFEWTFTDNRVVEYSCPAYEELGMKGVIVIGNPELPTIGEVLTTLWGGALAGSGLMVVLSPVALGVFLAVRGSEDTDSAEPAD